MKAESQYLRTPGVRDSLCQPRQVTFMSTKVPKFAGITIWEQYRQVFDAIVLSKGWDDATAAWISSRTQPQEPGRGEAQIIASRDGAMVWPTAQPTPMSQMVLRQPETVGVSTVLVEATPERSDRILSSVSDSVMMMAEEFQPDDGSRTESGFLQEAGGVLHVCTDFCWGGGGVVAAAATSPVLFAEDITEGVMLQTVAGAASLADFAEVVAADATSLADAAMVTMEVAVSADAWAASLADAGILFPADPAGVVDVGPVTMVVADLADAGILFPADHAGPVTMAVADLADAGITFPGDLAGPVTVGVVDLADAGILFPADPAGTVTVEVACLADAEEVTIGVTGLANAGMALPADPAGAVTVGVASLANAELVTTGVTNVVATPMNDSNSYGSHDGPVLTDMWCNRISKL